MSNIMITRVGGVALNFNGMYKNCRIARDLVVIEDVRRESNASAPAGRIWHLGAPRPGEGTYQQGAGRLLCRVTLPRLHCLLQRTNEYSHQ